MSDQPPEQPVEGAPSTPSGDALPMGPSPDGSAETVPDPRPNGSRPTLSVVIPTLNAAQHLGRTLDALAGGGIDMEIIIADGGSTDGTQRIARAFGATLIEAPRGRGPQLRTGAEAALGDWLFFLHADSVPQRGWQVILRGFTGNNENQYKAGYFQLILDDPAPAARRIEDLANWRSRHLALPYGDQGLVVSRAFYDFLDGFKDIPLMEDVDLVRRIGGKRLLALPSAVTTSAVRYRRQGWWLRPARNLCCLALFYAGAPPHWIAKLYD